MWLTDLRIVLPDSILERGALRIENGVIAEIVEGTPANTHNGTAVTAMPGLIAIPGIIDLHGDMLERDIEPRPGARFPAELALYELDKRLAAAGITTAYAAISFAWTKDNIRSQEYAEELIRIIHTKRDELLVDCQVHARFEVTNPQTPQVLIPMLEAGMIQLVSVMDHTPGQGQYKNVPKFLDFMIRWMGFDPTVLDPNLLEKLEQSVVETAAQEDHWDVIEQVTQVALAHNIKVASHDDDTVEKVDRLAAMGVTISEFPVTREAAQRAREHGMHIIMGAPNAYRGTSTSGNLSAREGITAGLVDILATDYFPAAPLHAAFLLAEQGIAPLHEAVKLVTQHPADAMGLEDRGRIEVGRRADIVLIEPGDHHRVRATLRSGVLIYRDSHLDRIAANKLAVLDS
jgi:alpha-D-ribose 1-methylphosphonate 5-triphosphate diphosphatase